MPFDTRTPRFTGVPRDPDERERVRQRVVATPDEPEQIAQFLADRTTDFGEARAADLYEAFAAYVEERGWIDYRRASVKAFGLEMTRRFEKRRDKRGCRYDGVALVYPPV